MHRFLAARAGNVAIFSALCLCVGLVAPTYAQNRFTDADLANGFYRTVFGLEYANNGRGAQVVKKFVGPVRVYIDQRARIDRRAVTRSFVRSVNRSVRGLDIRVVDSPLQANFTVYIVDRANYAQVIQDDVYNSSRATVRGRCMVRVLTGRGGISKAQAVIVSDEGDFLFNRCMVEEILQGLGPLNDDPSLTYSVFNDASRHTRFMLHDRYVLNLLYHPQVQPGMQIADVQRVLPRVIADVRGYVR
ncbi:MAG: DUF2927 domain-containing protein [Devosiaceae bacterium]|nr:DUF2927 domain-containing protein [Devosiaceae bacterium MH13]